MTCIGGLLDTVTGSVILTADEVKEVEGHIDQLNDENAKLRELVDELYPLADYGAMDASELGRAHDLMRELGVEVDG